MFRFRFTRVLPVALAGGLVLWPSAPRAQAPAQTAAQPETAVDARTWLGKHAEIEAWMRSVKMLKFEDLSVGVTKPKKAHLPPGGPMQYLAWKMIPPGRYGGYWESYQNEIAAYELDKMFELNMVPPTVEKTHQGERGAAVMWVSGVKSFKELGGAPTPPSRMLDKWNRQIVRAKMFHNLIANLDPNLGNWLVDPSWNLVLIDCTRCFTSDQRMTHQLTRIDLNLWTRMKTLTEADLVKAIGPLLASRGEVRAIIRRRDAMQQLIDKLIKERGEDYVFMRTG